MKKYLLIIAVALVLLGCCDEAKNTATAEDIAYQEAVKKNKELAEQRTADQSPKPTATDEDKGNEDPIVSISKIPSI
ncbi:MAG: hypothetical protein NUV61_00805 [Candidatus Azambacteria bacterium]|nr:hypothetical protein [Candidatus Azambacteria bacterium]